MKEKIEESKKRAAKLTQVEEPDLVERQPFKPEPKPFFPPPPEVEKELPDKPPEGAVVEALAKEPKEDPNLKELRKLLRPFDEKFGGEDTRKAVEAELPELDLAGYFSTGELRQKVPVADGMFDVTFRTVSLGEDLAIKKLIAEEEDLEGTSKGYVEDKFSIYATTLALVSTNVHKFTSHLVNGKFDRKSFLTKYDEILSLPFQSFAIIQIHGRWFVERVFDALKDSMIKKN